MFFLRALSISLIRLVLPDAKRWKKTQLRPARHGFLSAGMLQAWFPMHAEAMKFSALEVTLHLLQKDVENGGKSRETPGNWSTDGMHSSSKILGLIEMTGISLEPVKPLFKPSTGSVVFGCQSYPLHQLQPVTWKVWNAPTWFLSALTFAMVLGSILAMFVGQSPKRKRSMSHCPTWVAYFNYIYIYID